MEKLMLDDTEIIINGDSFSKVSGYRQLSLSFESDGEKRVLKKTRIFNRISSGRRYKRSTHQVAGDVVLNYSWDSSVSTLTVTYKSKTFQLQESLEEEELQLVQAAAKKFLSESSASRLFLMNRSSTAEHYLPVEPFESSETIIEEKKRLKKERFEAYFGIEVPDGYVLSPNKGLNYATKDMDFDPDDVPMSPDITHVHAFYGVSRQQGEIIKKDWLDVIDGKLQNWQKYHYIVLIETGAYENHKGRYGCKVDVYKTNQQGPKKIK